MSGEHKGAGRVTILSASVLSVGCVQWMTSVQPVATTAAAAAAYLTSQQPRGVHRTGARDGKDLPAATEDGHPNDSILHRIYSPAAYKRDH